MPRRPADNEQIRAAQRERILDAAAAVFARKGLAAGRIADVAADAGLSHGLIHHYFDGKADLHRAIVERTMDAADSLPRAARALPAMPWDRLAFYVGAALTGARMSPEQFFLVAETVMNQTIDPEVRRMVAVKGATGTALLAELIADGQAEGSVRPGDPLALATHVLAAVSGLAIARAGKAIDPDIVLGLLRPPREVR